MLVASHWSLKWGNSSLYFVSSPGCCGRSLLAQIRSGTNSGSLRHFSEWSEPAGTWLGEHRSHWPPLRWRCRFCSRRLHPLGWSQSLLWGSAEHRQSETTRVLFYNWQRGSQPQSSPSPKGLVDGNSCWQLPNICPGFRITISHS